MKNNLSEYLLGVSSDTLQIKKPAILAEHILHMVQQAERSIVISSYQLDHALFDSSELYEACKTLLINSRRSELRILLHQTQSVQQQGHRLIQLTQKIPSRSKIRVRTRPYNEDLEQFILIDNCGFVMQKIPTDYNSSSVCYNDRLSVKQMNERYNEAWEHARQANELRRLSI